MPQTISPHKKLLPVFLFSAVFATLFFAALEVAVREIQHKRLGPRAYAPAALRDPYTAWRNNPDFSTFHARHNAQGFRRDEDVALQKPPGTVRIFIVGGSAAYGSGGLYTEIENRYSRIDNHQLLDWYLEQKLNAAFPSRHWEVINAATNEFRVHQDLAEIESRLLRYHPDFVILLDGHNDVSGLMNAPPHYDPYGATPHLEEFNLLANPGSGRAISFFLATWLRTNSAFFRFMTDHLQWAAAQSKREHNARSREFGNPVQPSDLTQQERAQLSLALSQIDSYTHTVRQIHRILDLDGVESVFLLQPELALSHKPLTAMEKALLDYHRRVSGPFFIAAIEQFFPQLATRTLAVAQRDAFRFLDLTGVFDQSEEQTFTDYCHLTPEGYRITAERVFRFLEDSFAQKAGVSRVPGRAD